MDPIEVAQTLSEAGADASLWFCFGGEPDAPGFVLVNRASDPKGVEFGPQAKALAALGPATNGIATRKAGGPLSLISRSPFPGLIEGLASWAAAGLARAPGLEALRDARFTQVDAQNQVVETQEDPAAWARLDAAPAPDAAPVPAPDPATAQTLLALEKGAASCWFWLSQPDDNGVPTFILIDRTEDPKGVAFGGFMRDAVEAGAPAAGAARGIATFKEGSPPSLVARSAYADCIAALVAWRQTWSADPAAQRITGAVYTEVDAQNQVVDRQVDAGSWEAAATPPAGGPAAAPAAAPKESRAEASEAEQIGALLPTLVEQAQFWFWLGRKGEAVGLVLRAVEADPKRKDFDPACARARDALPQAGTLEEAVGRGRKMADGRFVFQALTLMPGFTESLQRWMAQAAAQSPGLEGLVGSRFQHVSPQGNVFVEQSWPSGSPSRRAEAPPAAPPAAAPAAPTPAAATLPQSEDLAGARSALDGLRHDLRPCQEAFSAALAASDGLVPVKIKDLGKALEALSLQVESWLELRADLEAARARTRALRRAAWGGAGRADLPAVTADAGEAADAAKALADACAEAEAAAAAWKKAASGPPMAARTPFALPELSLPVALRDWGEQQDLLELELDRACATAAPPAGAEELEAADQRAAEDRDSVGPALLDIAADGVAAAQALRQASDVLERHGDYRDRFPAPMKASFDSRSGELRAAMEQLGGTLLWLTRPEREADLE